MARKRKRRKGLVRSRSNQEIQSHVRLHIARLGLDSVDDYRRWCRDNGYSDSLSKSAPRCQQEWLSVLRRSAEAKLATAPRGRNPAKWIERILRGEVRVRDAPARLQRLAERVREGDPTLAVRSLDSTFELIGHVSRHTSLLEETSAPGQTSYAEVLVALSRESDSWRRPATEWRPRTHNSERQLSSLARHLYALWEVPKFLDSAWREGGMRGLEWQGWFLHLGRGGSVRELDLPALYTKRMAHCFLQAPPDFSIPDALRYGQVLALGGNERLARAIRETRLVRGFENEEFWLSVLRFFASNAFLEDGHVAPIIDYLQDQRFEERELHHPSGRIERLPPPRPNLTMKGRCAQRLLREVEEWHGALAQPRGGRAERRFEPSGLRPMRFAEGAKEDEPSREWVVRELLSTSQLVEEGRAMRHCVGLLRTTGWKGLLPMDGRADRLGETPEDGHHRSAQPRSHDLSGARQGQRPSNATGSSRTRALGDARRSDDCVLGVRVHGLSNPTELGDRVRSAAC